MSPQNEVKKMKQGMSYSCKEKTIILNVFKYFCNQFPDKCVTELVRRTAKATGCSEKSIFQFRKEEASAEGFKQPSKTKIRKNININSRDIKYDETIRRAIRQIIYDLKYKNIVPSLNTILKQIRDNSTLPIFSLMTLRRLLFDMGFSYEKNGNKCMLVEKEDKKLLKRTVNNHSENNKPVSHILHHSNLNNVPPPIPVDNVKAGAVQAPPPLPPPVAPPLPQNNIINPQLSHMNAHILEQQPHRLLPMCAMGQQDQHMMPQMHHTHNVPMMINHGMHMQPPPTHHRMPPPNDIHLKPPWIHHHMPAQNIVKQ